MNHSTAFPVAIARGASFDRALEARIADAIGKELRAQGANLFGGVCINLLRHPGWGRAQETYGEDPYLLGEMAAAMIQGVQRHNVMACAKHFALNSIEESRHTVDVRVDERTLREVYLPHFQRAVEAGVAAIMSAYNRVNGDYCAESAHLLREVLKGDWGFRGFVLSDFFRGVYDGVAAANAGLDLEMPVTQVYGKKLSDAVWAGQVPRERVEDSVRRILRRKVFYATRPDPQPYEPSLVRARAHLDLAREAAEKSMVLLKNDREVLPLERSRVRTLAVMGRLADGAENLGDHGSSRVYPPSVVSPLQGLREHLGAGTRVVHELGQDAARVRQLGREADAVVVIAGLDHRDEGESIPEKPEGERGGDRRDLGLHDDDVELIHAVSALNPRTIVVLIGGSALTMEEWRNEAPAILMAFYPGEEGGRALARVLFGDVNPSATPALHHPRRRFLAAPVRPEGHAGRVRLLPRLHPGREERDRASLPFRLRPQLHPLRLFQPAPRVHRDGRGRQPRGLGGRRQRGTRAGDAVVQLYAGFPASAVDRPVKLLRGFDKVSLGPGEKGAVRFILRAHDLAYWDTATGRFRVDEGAYEVLVGGSSRRADLLTAGFRVVAGAKP